MNGIENAIRSIPGNEPVLDELYKLLKSGDAIALVGAGASAGLWPLWNEFLQGFIEYARKNDKISNKESDYLLDEALRTPLKAAQKLHNKIGERLYFQYIQDIFSDKICPETGGAFTPVHKALMQLPIHNYVTLNYDAGLTNARAEIHPRATTTYYHWNQEEAGRILEGDYKRLVLHAHGRHDYADSIILTLDDFRLAYGNPAFVRLLDHLFSFKKLLIVGFGWTDPYIKKLFNNISADYKKTPLRHIALVGLEEKDLETSHLLRERVEMVYGSRILFYPAQDRHKALTDWLVMMAEKFSTEPGSKIAQEVKPLPTPLQLKERLPDRYIHNPTDDENFKGRAQDFLTLNRWANDPATRMIAITGIGGQGKTALTGRWLKKERSANLARMPVFYWSFYEDMDVGEFLEEVVKFCLPIFPENGEQEIEPIPFILRVVIQARLLFVLDGLEVLQEESDKPDHGRINHPLLEQLLHYWVRYPHQGLMILTSRFRFPQMERYSGVGFHRLDLVRLSKDDGHALLRKLNIIGEKHLLETWVERLYGHPLALRVLASTVKRCCHSELAQFKGDKILLDAGDKDRMSEKLGHLLGFYEARLKNGQKELLGIVSLFKRPVEIGSLVTVLKGMKSLKETPLANAGESEIKKQIELLIDDFLVEKTREGITTHPVIRDYFRRGNEIAGSRREVADFLKSRPGVSLPQNIEEVRDLVEAVQLLCDEGDFEAAGDLFISRLFKGGYGFNVFRDLPAVAEGLECCLAFVGNEDRIKNVEKILGSSIVGFHYAGVALYNYYLGNLAQALEWRNKSLEIRSQLNDKCKQAISLNNISIIEMVMGRIFQARETVSTALKLSHETGDLDDLRTEFASKAFYEFLLGNSIQAYKDFEISLLYEQKQRPYQQYLYSIMGNYQAEFLIRIQEWKLFEPVNAWDIMICKKNRWNDTLALCFMLQAWYEISRGKLSDAEKTLMQAESILRPSCMVEYICRMDWVWALLFEAIGDYQKGLHRVNDSLFISADKGFRLRQADHLILRARLEIMQFQREGTRDRDLLEKAGDDANEALKIAEQTGYAWAKLEALEFFASYHQIRSSLSGFNSQDERELSERHAKEAKSHKQGLFLTQEQIKEIKSQARTEFETQIAEWEKKR